MSSLAEVAPAFVEMAHRIVWATAATVSPSGRARTRILHPIWQWDASAGVLEGWIATGPTPLKRADLEHSPSMSLNYWTTNHDTCRADCSVEWRFDDDTRTWLWDFYKSAPAPVGYDPSIIAVWDSPTSPAFAALKLTPVSLRVYPGTLLLGAGGELLTWHV